MRRNDGGRLFHMDGAATENARWPRLVLVLTTVAAPLVAERRRLLLQSAFVKWTKSQRYGGQSWCCTLWTRVAILNVIRWRTGSQWSFFKAGVMWALRFRPRTRRAAVFWFWTCSEFNACSQKTNYTVTGSIKWITIRDWLGKILCPHPNPIPTILSLSPPRLTAVVPVPAATVLFSALSLPKCHIISTQIPQSKLIFR